MKRRGGNSNAYLLSKRNQSEQAAYSDFNYMTSGKAKLCKRSKGQWLPGVVGRGRIFRTARLFYMIL